MYRWPEAGATTSSLSPVNDSRPEQLFIAVSTTCAHNYLSISITILLVMHITTYQ